MNRGTTLIPAETRVMLRRSDFRGLPFGIAVALVCFTVCQAQGQIADERAVDAQRAPVADRQTAGSFDRLAGEYRGTSDGDAFVVWVDALAADEEGQQAALLLFQEQDRPRLETYIKRMIDNPADQYRKVCERAGPDGHKNRLNDLYRVWNTQGGLILLMDGFHRDHLPLGWEEIESQEYPPFLRNQEYIVWQEREYAIRRIRRSAETGDLESVQLTQTGFIQNFFDNPVIGVTRVDDASPSFKLLGSYLDAKFAAWEKLDASYQPDRGGATVLPTLAGVCKTLMSNDAISEQK